MNELIKIGRIAAMTASETAVAQLTPEGATSIENEADFIADEAINDESINDEATGGVTEDETDIDLTEDIEGEGLVDNTGEEIIIEPGMEEVYTDEGAYIDPGFVDGGYIDPGYYEGGYMEPGMEMGIPEMKDPLLSSWPFVIGISAAVLIVSVALGAFLAKLKIKKGIDLYED